MRYPALRWGGLALVVMPLAAATWLAMYSATLFYYGFS
jgi:hypothetical protein